MKLIHYLIAGGTFLTLVTLAPLLLFSFTTTPDINLAERELNHHKDLYQQTASPTLNIKGRSLVAGMGDTCVLGYNDGDISTVNPLPKPIVIDPLRPLNYCGEFNSGSCCSNIMAQEITDAFNHLMDVGGTGGVPIDEERCLQYAKKTYVALKDYFCLFCNPRQIQYLGCCNAAYRKGGNCADPKGTATHLELMTPYGTGDCVGKKSDTLRICKTFATKLWGDKGEKYDQCGMMIWNSHREDIIADDNAWADDKTLANGNPVGITPWGDVDGRNGKWGNVRGGGSDPDFFVVAAELTLFLFFFE